MATPPPRNPEPPESAPSRDALEVRIALLRKEIEGETDRGQKAAIHYEIGALIERRVRNEALAVKEYLTAYNLDPSLRPPLYALVRIFERRRSFKNLARLYNAEAKSASAPGERASALLDHGVLLEDHLGQAEDARHKYEQALEADPSALAAALSVERAARGGAEREAAARAVAARSRYTHDAMLKSLLLVEQAWDRAEAGDLDAAFELAREAVELPAGRWRALDQMERIARRHDRSLELIEALEGRAVLATAMARGEDQGQGSGAFSVRRFTDEAKASAEAAALWYESAQLRLAQHGDAAGAMQALDQAIALRPDDVVLHQERMLACELAGNLEGAAEEARYLIDRGVSGRFAASLHFRLAELAQARDDVDAATRSLGAALEADPGSAAAAALLDDLLLDRGAHADRVARYEARAEAVPSGRVDSLWRAAQIASEQLADFPRARGLYERAIEAAAASERPERRTSLLRELYGAALRHGDGPAARDTVQALLDATDDEEERAALLRDLHELLSYALDDEAGAEDVLRRALDDPLAVRWAATAARLHAARKGDEALLAQAHAALADRVTEEEAQAAHLCAAARAQARAGDEEQAIATLRRALERSPGHRYAVALLEEMLRARGEADEVVALLREAAAAQAGLRAAEMNLLLAGAAAEAGGDIDLAKQTYEEAADRDPTSFSPVLSLRRLAERAGDRDLRLRALERASELETSAGEPGRATFELGEHYDLLTGKPELAEGPLERTVPHAAVGLAAAAELLLLPGRSVDPKNRLTALQRLMQSAKDDAVPLVLRTLAGEALVGDGDPVQTEESLEALADVRPDDRWVHVGRLRMLSGATDGDTRRADAWTALGQATDDETTAGELLLHGMRARMAAQGAQAADDAFLTAQEIAAISPGSAATGVALDETLTGGDDPESRVEALAARLEHAGREGRATVGAVVGRALTAAGRSGEALAALRKVLEESPDDLASWEAMRVAAREQQSWEDVVRACDELAKHVDGELKAQLLEESAATLMDDLGRDAEAEKRLTTVVEMDVGRPIAFYRLHDLLAEREETGAIIDLVSRRIDVIDDSDELVRLFYEQARLLRSEGNREGALGALDNVLMLEDDHVGALALKVEIHVSMEQWAEAVETLRSIADADVPPSQKRVARLGAADFLEKHLSDPKGAIDEMRRIADVGLADSALYVRMAEMAERSGLYEEAVRALGEAANASTGIDRASFERRAGALHERQGDRDRAVEAYRRALAEVPDDLAAGERLSELLVDPEERRQLSSRFEAAVRATLERNPGDEDQLRKLRQTAIWRGERDLEFLALSALVAVGLAMPEEQEAWAERQEMGPTTPSGKLAEDDLARLRAPAAAGPLANVARAAHDGLAEMDRLEPATYGVGRGDSISPKQQNAVRDEISGLCAVFGLEVGDFYVGGRDAAQIAAMPGKKGRVTWVVGDGVRAPLNAEQRFVVGQLGMALVEGTLAFVQRRPEDAATVLHAAAAAAETPLPGGASRANVEELRRALERKLGRKGRRAVAEAATGVRDADVDDWARDAHRTVLRAGLLLSGDLRVALAAVTSADDAEGRATAARDLIGFWLSDASLALRAKLGLSQ